MRRIVETRECQPLSHAERRIEDTPSELHAEKKDSNGSAEDGFSLTHLIGMFHGLKFRGRE